ncbi:hypothetical protein A3Q56_07190 [Intoshia linei]|uniref:Uncharacterized protein n=1 Tax=Intoshia linei TaxID=1819745 RepID=A0A177ASN3_9BILA|nr:hypothetical protein A3Q56_07190 [Intoshia linei]
MHSILHFQIILLIGWLTNSVLSCIFTCAGCGIVMACSVSGVGVAAVIAAVGVAIYEARNRKKKKK